MRKNREQKPATAPVDPEAVLRRQESSEKLRASYVALKFICLLISICLHIPYSKSFAEFRELVRQTMFWVSIDDKDPEQLAAYKQFLASCNANPSRMLCDDNLEFLFRHVNPPPLDYDDDNSD
jgi:hypothetical protein